MNDFIIRQSTSEKNRHIRDSIVERTEIESVLARKLILIVEKMNSLFFSAINESVDVEHIDASGYEFLT
jgi:hypothetical protein